MSNLTTFPVVAGASQVFTVTPNGELGVYAKGVTAVLGLAFDNEGRLYVLETSGPGSGQEAPIVPGTGRVVRLTDNGELEVVATGLVFPTGMAFGPDGTLYVSNFGFGFPRVPVRSSPSTCQRHAGSDCWGGHRIVGRGDAGVVAASRRFNPRKQQAREASLASLSGSPDSPGRRVTHKR